MGMGRGARSRASGRPGRSLDSGTMLALFLRLLPRALLDPRLAVALLRVLWRFRRNRWWARFPFLPLPARDYVRWRMYTAYGDHDALPPVEDVIKYARWAR